MRNPLHEYLFRYDEDDDPRWDYSFRGWQGDEDIISNLKTVNRPWRDDEIAGRLDSTTSLLPLDVVILRFWYRYFRIISWEDISWEDGQQAVHSECTDEVDQTACLWIKGSSLLSYEDDVYETITRLVKDVIISFATEFVYDVSEIVNEMMWYLATLPSNANRIVFDINARCHVRGTHEYDPEVNRVVFVEFPREEEISEEEDDTDVGQFEKLTMEEKSRYEDAIESLPRAKLLEDSTTCCAVCVEQVLKGEEVFLMPCAHFFHEDCLSGWLQKRNACPVCRYELLF